MLGTMADEQTVVYLERGKKKVFACSLDWPGWCRSGKTDEVALEALGAYANRYAVVAQEGGVPFPDGTGTRLHVVETVTGNVTTDFGAPAISPDADLQPLSTIEADRLATLVAAAWPVFERVVAGAPAELRKGPRGGGRDRDKIVDHVLGAEAGYARYLGVRHKQPAADDEVAVAALRQDIVDAIRSARGPEPLKEKGWPIRYAARRIAWHVLDHAWEIEDRADPVA